MMDWGLEDLTAATILLVGAGIALAIILRTVHHRGLQMLGVIAAVLIFLAIWAHLAVGIF